MTLFILIDLEYLRNSRLIAFLSLQVTYLLLSTQSHLWSLLIWQQICSVWHPVSFFCCQTEFGTFLAWILNEHCLVSVVTLQRDLDRPISLQRNSEGPPPEGTCARSCTSVLNDWSALTLEDEQWGWVLRRRHRWGCVCLCVCLQIVFLKEKRKSCSLHLSNCSTWYCSFVILCGLKKSKVLPQSDAGNVEDSWCFNRML